MNDFGLILVWCAIQITLLGAAAGCLYLLLRRLGPSAGSLIAVTSLALVVALSALSFSPWPCWSSLDHSDVTRPQESNSMTPSGVEAAPSSSAEQFANVAANSENESDVSTMAEFFTIFRDELQNRQPVDVESMAKWEWPAIIAGLFLIGLLAGAIRLWLGLAAVRSYRIKSRPIADKELLEMAADLKAELRCRRPVQLRESDALVTAATIGWRRPLILLSSEWTGWSDQERRAVLAHEIAHIRRNDFLAWCCAQVGLALHFYHPLVHWLAGRLRLDQELAADAAAARLAGGQRPYLATLAEMALRQAECPVGWPARTFLPTRRTFLRRIEMLRDSNQLATTLSAGKRLLTVGVLLLFGLAVVGVRSPGRPVERTARAEQPADGTPTFRIRTAKTGNPATSPEMPFSLAYVPRDAVLVVSARPASLLKRPAMQALAADLKKAKAAGFSEPYGLAIDQISEITFVFLPGTGGRWEPELAGTIIRSKQPGKDADRAKIFVPNPVKEQYFNQDYYSSRSKNRSLCFCPDSRTIVIAPSEGFLRRLIVAGKLGATQTRWAKAWNDVRNDDAAALCNVAFLRAALNGRLMRRPDRLQLATFAPLWESPTTATLGIKIGRQLTVHARANCEGEDDAKLLKETLAAGVTLGKNALSKAREAASAQPGAEGPSLLTVIDVVDALIDALKIEQHDQSVVLNSSATAEETAKVVMMLLAVPASNREAARRSQSKNNLRQLALAFHNYHGVHWHFPPAVVIGPDGKTPHSWRVELLPYLNQKPLYDQYKLDEPWDSPHNKKLIEKIPAVFRHPSAAAEATNSSYFVLTGEGTVFSGGKGTTLRDLTDGASNTILLVEAKRDIPWTKPDDIAYDPKKEVPKLGGFHKGLFQIVLCDASCRVVMQDIDKKVLRNLITKSDGQQIPQF